MQSSKNVEMGSYVYQYFFLTKKIEVNYLIYFIFPTVEKIQSELEALCVRILNQKILLDALLDKIRDIRQKSDFFPKISCLVTLNLRITI